MADFELIVLPAIIGIVLWLLTAFGVLSLKRAGRGGRKVDRVQAIVFSASAGTLGGLAFAVGAFFLITG